MLFGKRKQVVKRILIVEDEPLTAFDNENILGDAGYEIVSQSLDAEDLKAAVRRDPPYVVVTDIRMPPTHTNEGLQAALSIRTEFPQVAVLVLSQYIETRYAMELLEANPGGVGYLLKDRLTDVSEISDAVRRIVAGGTVVDPDVIAKLLQRRREQDSLDTLDDQERGILAMMAEGLSDQAIAERTASPRDVVESEIAEIFSKLGLEAGASDHRRVLAVLTYLRG